MPGLKFKKGDTVAIIAGKDLGTQGRILDVLPKKNKVIVEGVNRVTRHEKIAMDRRGQQTGGIAHKEAAVNISNIALVCPNDGPTRAGYSIDPDTGAKTRICRKCGGEL
jgi:large subunit ribosomal protein L24